MFTRHQRRPSAVIFPLATIAATVLFLGGAFGLPAASAAQPAVGMGTTSSFAVLAGSTITNTGPSVISGSLGLSPGTAMTGFPPGTVINGVQHAADAVAGQAQSDLTTAYNNAAGRTPVTVESNPDLGGQNLAPGVYKGTSSLSLTGTVTLDGQNNANAVFIFQAASTLITASNSTVHLINGASWCNIFWQVGSSATLGTGTTFVGNIMALTSATLNTGASVQGRVLARNGAVTLDTNTVTQPACTVSSGTPGGTGTGSNANGTGTGTNGTGINGNGLGGGSNSGGLGSGVVPTGFPATGLGGASHSSTPGLVAIGGFALVGALLMTVVGFRRRRRLEIASSLTTMGRPNGAT